MVLAGNETKRRQVALKRRNMEQHSGGKLETFRSCWITSAVQPRSRAGTWYYEPNGCHLAEDTALQIDWSPGIPQNGWFIMETSMCHIEVLVHTWLGRTQFSF